MVRVLLLQHLISRFCVDSCTVSAREVFWRELPCCNWRRVVACGLNNGAMKHSCRTTQFVRVVTLKLNQKSTASTFAKETQKVTPTLWTLLPRQIGFCLIHVKDPRSLICVHFSCEAWHQVLGWWRRHTMDQRFSLLPMPSTMVFILALARMVPNCILTRAVVRSVGVSVLSQLIFHCAQERMDQSRLITLPYQWRNSFRSFSWLRGQLDPFTSTRTASTYMQTRTNLHNARNEELTSHSGPGCSKLCRDIRERSRPLSAKSKSPQTISTSWR